MSDLDFFNPSGGSESYDPAAFERFKEQIKKNAAFIAAARKGEQKQKQKEDRLAKILLQFIQRNQKSGILLLAARMLEENIPASFVLSVILLGNDELAEELKKEAVQNVPQLEAGASEPSPSPPSPPDPTPNEFSLVTGFSDGALPLKIKAEIDAWGKGIFEAGSAIPFRILETVLSKEGSIKKVTIDCAANVLDDFFAQNDKAEIAYDTCFSFCEFFMKGVMKKLQQQIENQKELQ